MTVNWYEVNFGGAYIEYGILRREITFNYEFKRDFGKKRVTALFSANAQLEFRED